MPPDFKSATRSLVRTAIEGLLILNENYYRFCSTSLALSEAVIAPTVPLHVSTAATIEKT